MHANCNREWAIGSEMKPIAAVQSALVAAFRIPERDRDVVLDLYEENRRIVSEGHSERFARVEIVGIAARSLEAKRALFKAIADNLQAVGGPRKEMRIFLIEPQAENWGVGSGLLASEVDMGFKIDVQAGTT